MSVFIGIVIILALWWGIAKYQSYRSSVPVSPVGVPDQEEIAPEVATPKPARAARSKKTKK